MNSQPRPGRPQDIRTEALSASPSEEAAPEPVRGLTSTDSGIAYDIPDQFANLAEVSSPEPVENAGESSAYRHQDIESRGGGTAAPRRRTRCREPAADGRRRRRSVSRAAQDGAFRYDVPPSFGDLNEVQGPPPVENPDERPLARHHSLEERIERRKSWSAAAEQRRQEEGEGAVRDQPRAGPEEPPTGLPTGPPTGRPRWRHGPRRVTISRLRTELYTVAYLIFFSILGTLARLGLNTLTTYTGAPVSFGVLWSNFAGTAVLGFLAELSPLINRDHAALASAHDDNGDGGDDVGEKNDADPNSSGTVGVVQPSAAEDNNAHGESSNDSGNNNVDDVVRGDHDAENGAGVDSDGTEDEGPQSPMAKRPRPIPLYVGLATGFCGSFTSFSSFMMDVFDALANTLPAPRYHPGDAVGQGSSSSEVADRRAGYDVMALLAVLFLTVCMCLSALKCGAHMAIAVSRLSRRIPRCFAWLPPRVPRLLRVLDNGIVFLALAAWLAAVLLAIFQPGLARPEHWRGDALFALVFGPLGCLLRFYISMKLNPVFATFPLGTFVVNILGTAVLGAAWDLQHGPLLVTHGSVVGCQVLQGIMDGFCGCLTTVSTWITELSGLQRRHAYFYGFVSMATGLAVLVLSMGTLKWTVGWQEPVCTA